MSTSVVAVYLTFPDHASAERLARLLVEERLAACVNVLRGARSVYRWEGAVVSDEEVIAVAKTTRCRLEALSERVHAEHPHEVPCVVAYPALGGLGAYLDWVDEETRSARP